MNTNRTFARNLANTSSGAAALCKTPTAAADRSVSGKISTKTPNSNSRKRTPGKNLKLTPSRNANFVGGNKTPGGGDRFIPNRSESQNDLALYLISTSNNCTSESINSSSQNVALSPQKLEYQRIVSENLNGGVTAATSTNSSMHNDSSANFRILTFQKTKAPLAPQGYANANQVLYSTRPTPASSCKKSIRHIPTLPERILDAPEMLDDYYLNLLDWSASNILGVALSGQVFLWNAATGDIELLFEMESTSDVVTSISFVKEGNYLAVGTSDAQVQLWDVEAKRRLRSMTGHDSRVGALSWNSYVLSSGTRSGIIHNSDVRVPEHLVGVLNNHTQEVCGLKWSHDGRFLASGGNDNLLNIWQSVANDFRSETSPLYTLSDHQAAVKALAWCPWQGSVLASGGGTADRCIRFWNVNTGSCLSTHDTQSQVCALLWSKQYKELLSSHGYPSYQLSIWKYPQMAKMAELVGHTGRILHTVMSPCGEYVVSAAADESLRIWHCFAVDPEDKKKSQSAASIKKANKVRTGSIPSSIR